ncbi:AsnC family transcriptional regulator [Pseudomonas sp. StFLB209]|nr:AsnC family transcriptional regulator [Pseudomonas sp. StFLB209]
MPRLSTVGISGLQAGEDVNIKEGTREAVAAFETALLDIVQVVEAQRLFGDPDYLLHVITRDLPAFQRLYDEQLTSLPNVQQVMSTLVMKQVIAGRPLPI